MSRIVVRNQVIFPPFRTDCSFFTLLVFEIVMCQCRALQQSSFEMMFDQDKLNCFIQMLPDISQIIHGLAAVLFNDVYLPFHDERLIQYHYKTLPAVNFAFCRCNGGVIKLGGVTKLVIVTSKSKSTAVFCYRPYLYFGEIDINLLSDILQPQQ